MTQVAAGEKKQVKEKKFNKYVSFSQYSMYYKCPRSWKLAYVDNLRKKESNIHLVFGTSMHEVIQDYLEMMYNQPHLDAVVVKLVVGSQGGQRPCPNRVGEEYLSG